MQPIWMTIEPRPSEVRLLVTEPGLGPSLKARLPQPAAHSRGLVLLLEALSVWYRYLENKRPTPKGDDIQRGSYLGPSFSNKTVEVFLEENNKILKPILESYINKYKDERNKFQKLVEETKAQILTREEELEELRTELDKLEDRTYYQSRDQAQKAMLDLNSKHHSEEIELAGMHAKLEAIKEHRTRVSKIVEGRASNEF